MRLDLEHCESFGESCALTKGVLYEGQARVESGDLRDRIHGRV